MDRIDYWSWFRRILFWDTFLPAVVAMVPIAIETFFPRRDALELVASAMIPAAAFALRVRSGLRHIRSNHCSQSTRFAQKPLFIIGLFPLFLIECATIQGIPVQTKGDVALIAILIAIYLATMILAMYPGRSPVEEWADEGFPR